MTFDQAEYLAHAPPQLPPWAEGAFDVSPHGNIGALCDAFAKDVAPLGRFALIDPAAALDLNLPLDDINPKRSLTEQCQCREDINQHDCNER